MGSTLYNKIYLGRTPLLGSRRAQLVLMASLAVGFGLGWIALRSLR